MKLYLDTANDDFVIAAFDENYNLVYKEVLKNYRKKVGLITHYVKLMLKATGKKIKDFKTYYTNLGPGYFTGVRISLVFLRTIACAQRSELKTISTMQILERQNPLQNEFFINARGEKYYYYRRTNMPFDKSLLVCQTGVKDKYDAVDYVEFIHNFFNYLDCFKGYKNLRDIEPYYIKKPQIGRAK